MSALNNIVLVTGGAGYIGSHVCKALSQKGFLPITYDNLCSGNKGAVQWGPFEQGDIRDRARLAEVIRIYKPHAVMHFAALIQVGDSVINPAEFYDNNVYGSLCLLQEATMRGIRHLVFSSTAAVYGTPEMDLLDESAPLKPINPYGQTKLAMENMIRDFSQAYDLQYAILRYFNAAGADPETQLGTAYKKDTHIIPCLMKVCAGMVPEIRVFGNDYDTPDGTAIRDYVHVSDLAEAHIKALRYITTKRENITMNLGTSQGYSVRQVLDTARRVTGQPISEVIDPRRAGDPPVLVANAELAKRQLGWTPAYSDMDTIVRTAWAWRKKQSGMVFAADKNNDQEQAEKRRA